MQVGWGEDATGFEVQQMQNSGVAYAGIPSATVTVVLRFRSSAPMDFGGRVVVEAPQGFVLSCMGAALKQITLPRPVLECKKIDTWKVQLMLGTTLLPGDYAFGIEATTPQATPTPSTANRWSLLLKDYRGLVRDAATTLAGRTINQDLRLSASKLEWTAAEAGQASSLTIGFKVLTEVPKGALGSLLLMLPANFAHSVDTTSGVTSKNDQLPLRQAVQGPWVDFAVMDRIVVYLDPNLPIKVGEYKFSFPVTVPEQIPPYNVWSLSLCSYSATIPETRESLAV
jgi:hypothetical protein